MSHSHSQVQHNACILLDYLMGVGTQQHIADREGLSVQRVNQIIKDTRRSIGIYVLPTELSIEEITFRLHERCGVVPDRYDTNTPTGFHYEMMREERKIT